jgi:hypothetical protein
MRMEIWNEALQQLPQLFVPMLGTGRIDQALDSPHHTFRKDAVSGAQYLRVIRRQHILGAEERFLVQLSPGRIPVNLISMSAPTVRPESLIRSVAISTMRIGSPI